jgi:low affinity Fe/Cu permease
VEDAREVDGELTRFDRFADAVGRFTAKSWFFAGCALLVLLWLPSYFLVGEVDTWQLLINTPTTIVTFLLVALLQNTQTRSDKAVHAKLNAVIESLTFLHNGLLYFGLGARD